ncbi:MAG TPA: winged helix-turn-helix transcriptional regulator [Acidimicrobiales bacterium]|nr:winged helix-turn-helix transcriptional regulator [Acidimicrobiales bacterium]
MGSRHQLLLLLRKHPGVTVAELAQRLAMSGMGVRRHLAALAADGLVEQSTCTRAGPGRPPAGWRLSASGMEMFPRRYDALALDLLEDLTLDEAAGALDRRNDKQVALYQAALSGCSGLEEQVAELARLRDEAGYLAEWRAGDDETLVLTENNCAVHRVAEHHPVICAMELSLLRRVLGPEVEVVRMSHAMSGDAVCSYCIRPLTAE